MTETYADAFCADTGTELSAAPLYKYISAAVLSVLKAVKSIPALKRDEEWLQRQFRNVLTFCRDIMIRKDVIMDIQDALSGLKDALSELEDVCADIGMISGTLSFFIRMYNEYDNESLVDEFYVLWKQIYNELASPDEVLKYMAIKLIIDERELFGFDFE